MITSTDDSSQDVELQTINKNAELTEEQVVAMPEAEWQKIIE